MLVDHIRKYEMDLASIVEDTEWTQFIIQTDGLMDGQTDRQSHRDKCYCQNMLSENNSIARNFKDIYTNKPPLPTDVLEYVNTPISCIDTTDIDDIKGFNSYSLKDIAKCATLPHENIPASGLLGDGKLNNAYVSRDAEASCHLVAPFILNQHIHPFGIINPKYHCDMNSVIQLLFSVLRTISHNFHFYSRMEVSYPNFYLKQHIVYPVLQIWMHSNFNWYNMINSTMAKVRRMLRNVLQC